MKRNPPTFAGLVAALAITVSPFGCSYLLVTAPPENHQKLYDFECTSGNVFPVVDSVVATVYGIGVAGMIADKSEPTSTIIPAAVAAATFATSAVLGYGRTRDCREARAKLVARLDTLRRPGTGLEGDGSAGDARWGSSVAADPWLAPGLMAPPAAASHLPGAPPPAPSTLPAPPPAPPDSDRSQPNPKED